MSLPPISCISSLSPFKTLQWLCIEPLRQIPKLFSTTHFLSSLFSAPTTIEKHTLMLTRLHACTHPFKNNSIVSLLCLKISPKVLHSENYFFKGSCTLLPGHLWPPFLPLSPLVTLAILTQQLLPQGLCAFCFLYLDILLSSYFFHISAQNITWVREAWCDHPNINMHSDQYTSVNIILFLQPSTSPSDL